ncbi:DUF4167 domain-containing protein [Rhodovulum bhavnagarense]|nr:DUF4167 domain-containing protein [Rhodovulum bhavnagarense]
MRSSKSRSRSKSNRSRSMGNIVNRVFDSSGPEGKVRGTPQQIIDKYNQLARDAQLSNDRVAAENFQQHAEHYLRLLGEALREQEARREQQEAQQGRERGRARENGPEDDQPAPETRRADDPDTAPAVQDMAEGAEVIEFAEGEEDSTLVDTPEEKPAPKARRPRKPRSPARPARESVRAEDQPTEAETPAAE